MSEQQQEVSEIKISPQEREAKAEAKINQLEEKWYTPFDKIPIIVAEARDVANSRKLHDVAFRKQQLRALLKLVTDNEKAICEALWKDLHKGQGESFLCEIAMLRSEIGHAINSLDDWVKPEYVSVPLIQKLTSPHIRKDPLGVVLNIGAWNYPVQLVLVPLVGIIAAGNACIMKPSELSVNIAKLLAELIPQYLDPKAYQVINGSVEETTKLLEQKFDKILYTGNGHVARVIMTAAAKYLTPVVLELGGKSPAIVTDHADLRTAARRIVWGRFLNAGQTCIAPDYILCSKAIEPRLVEEIKVALAEFWGPKPQESKDFGRIVNKRHFQRISNLINSSGGKILIGGESDENELFIAPTVITECKEGASILNEEIFGPVLPIINVANVDEAIQYINSRDKPLALYAFTTNNSVAEKIFTQTSSGAAVINDTLMHSSCAQLPFGGVGESGMGAYHGKHTFDTFSHSKACMWNSSGFEFANKIRYPPYEDSNLKNVERLVVEKPKSSWF